MKVQVGAIAFIMALALASALGLNFTSKCWFKILYDGKCPVRQSQLYTGVLFFLLLIFKHTNMF